MGPGEAYASPQALLDGLVAGDEAALARVHADYSGPVYGLALRILRDSGRAEEVTQDVFAAAWRHRSRFDWERGSLGAWLLAAARNRAIDLTRGHWRQQRLESSIPAGARSAVNVEDAVLGRLERRALADAVSALPAEQRHVIEEAYFAGRSLPDIADAAGVPVSTIKGRIRLGRRRLARNAGLQTAVMLAVA